MKYIRVAARSSALSRAQVREIQETLHHMNVVLEPLWITTQGDREKERSLWDVDLADFFTKEVDDALLSYTCRIAIHSAKDLPKELARGLSVVAYTKSLDPSDVLVYHEETRHYQRIGTSSWRRMESVWQLYPHAHPIDMRGTIEERLSLLDTGFVDALVMAKAALLRLHLAYPTHHLPGPFAPMQGRLAIVARSDDKEMKELFACLKG